MEKENLQNKDKTFTEIQSKLKQELENYIQNRSSFTTYTQTIKKMNDWINSGEIK